MFAKSMMHAAAAEAAQFFLKKKMSPVRHED
jgi:hypothetical protein